jgi:hypothetical protein
MSSAVQASLGKADSAYQRPAGGIPASDLTTSAQTALSEAASAYQKPAGGVPKSDLATSVQTSLFAADSAYQKPAGGIPAGDLTAAAQTALTEAASAYQKPAQGIPSTDLTTAAQATLAAGGTAYQKPAGGVPKTDLAAAVQTSLTSADSAYQKPPGGIPTADLSSGAQTSLGRADSAYQKPAGGVPKTDLTSAVQTSLAAADSAYQKPANGIPSTDMSTAVQTALAAAGSAYQKAGSGIPKGDLAADVQSSLASADSAYQKPGTGIPESDLDAATRAKIDAVGGTATAISLSSDHVLAASDDNVIYYVTGPILVTVPSGLAPKPNVGFVCPPTGSITLRVSGAATHDGGLTTDVVKNRGTDPAGFSVLPATLPSDASSQDYLYSGGLATFGNLGGNATDNASLVAQFPTFARVPYGMHNRVRYHLTGNLQIDPSQCVDGGLYPPGTVFYNNSGANKVVTMNQGAPLNWWFELRHESGSSFATSVAKGTGVSWTTRQTGGSDMLRITQQGGMGLVRSYAQDKYEFGGSDWVV